MFSPTASITLPGVGTIPDPTPTEPMLNSEGRENSADPTTTCSPSDSAAFGSAKKSPPTNTEIALSVKAGNPLFGLGMSPGSGQVAICAAAPGGAAAALVAEPRATSDAAPIPTAAMLAANRLYC